MTMKFNLDGLDRFGKQVANDKSGPMHSMFLQWGKRYLAFVQRRFDSHSKGGGDWPPLKESTKKRRRGKVYSILRDTGTLFNALSIGFPGNLYQRIKDGIRVGFGGPARHTIRIVKNKKTKQKTPIQKGVPPTIKDLAVIHDEGRGRVPKRQILVEPDDAVKKSMQNDLKRALDRIGKSIG